MFILLKIFIELVTRRKNVQLPRSALFGIIFKDKKITMLGIWQAQG
jgi:hypothetical protein